MKSVCLSIVTLLLLAQSASAAPATRPADFLVGPVHYQTLRPTNYLYTSTETTLNKIQDAIEEAMPNLLKGFKQVQITGPMIMVYHNATPDPEKPFKLDVGFPIMPPDQEPAGLKVRELPQLKCATIIYTGPIDQIGKAYEKIMPAVFQAGHKTTGEIREVYMYWEDPNSPNNVVQIQVGIK